MSAASEAQIGVQVSHLKQSSWKDYGIRFVFGGVITAVVGILGKAYGPVIAGLFLAFPAILPASLTIVAKHEDEEKAGIEAAGAAIGSVGLISFAIIIWRLAPHMAAWSTLAIATATWLIVSLIIWAVFQLGRRVTHPAG